MRMDGADLKSNLTRLCSNSSPSSLNGRFTLPSQHPSFDSSLFHSISYAAQPPSTKRHPHTGYARNNLSRYPLPRLSSIFSTCILGAVWIGPALSLCKSREGVRKGTRRSLFF